MKASDFVIESFPVRNTNKIYSLLINTIGSGPFDGGCVVFARALQIKFGGDIFVLVGHAQRTTSTNEIAQHAVLMVDNTLVDAAGSATPGELARRFTKNELAHAGGSITQVRKIQPDDLPDAPRNEELSTKIAKML
jgi:hypothetical protein